LSRSVEVVRTHLELRSPDQLRPARDAEVPARFVRHAPCPVDHYRRLYRDVGRAWYWRDRESWTDEALATLLSSPDIAVWECLVGDESAGYFELARHDDGAVEIAYFGLVERFFGLGLGGAMLTRAAREAWAMGATRVWLHTCTLDSPRALPNYKARGFEEFLTERYVAYMGGGGSAMGGGGKSDD
jgi:GNAT superfamily N-acetyltransferase